MPIRIPCVDEDVILDDPGIADFFPIFRHPLFRRTGKIKQLGQVALYFPGATHSRLEHLLGTYVLTRKQCLNWYRLGLIRMSDVVHLCGFAILHDIGHIPFSHALEPLFPNDHHQNGARIITDMETTLASCGVSAELVKDAMLDKWPLAAAVQHGILGPDKLDYLRRDGEKTGMRGLPDIMRILTCTRPIDGRIGVDKSAQSECLNLVEFMLYMYSRVYERSKNAYARRVIQQIYELASARTDLSWERIRLMTDDQFEAACYENADEQTRYLLEMFNGEHELPWTGLVVCQQGYGRWYQSSAKTMRRVIELDHAEFNSLAAKVSWKNASRLERAVSEVVNGGNPFRIFIQPPIRPKRYTLPETLIIDGKETYPLSDILPPGTMTVAAEKIRVIRIGTDDRENILPRLFQRNEDVLNILRQPTN